MSWWERENRKVLSRCLKTASDGADATWKGRWFQTVGPLTGRPGLRVAVWPQGQSRVCAGLSLRPIGCTPALSVTQSAATAAVCCWYHYISDRFTPCRNVVARIFAFTNFLRLSRKSESGRRGAPGFFWQRGVQWWILKFLKEGEAKAMYQPRHTSSQMRIINYMQTGPKK